MECIKRINKGKNTEQDPNDMIIPPGFFDNTLDNVRPDNKSSLSKKSQSGPVHERYRYGGYGVAGSSKAATTPTNPIVISSSDENEDDKTPIKKKNNRKPNRKPNENEDGKTKEPIKKKNNKKHKKQQKKRKRSVSRSSFEESDKSDDEDDSSAPRRSIYLHAADLPKDLREALRVSRSLCSFL